METWLNYAEFQKVMLSSSSDTSAKAVTEHKMEILERALSMNLEDNDERLLLEYLTCCEQVWGSAKLLTKWEQVLREHPDSLELWQGYLDFRQANFASFTFTGCLKAFESGISRLRKRISVKHRTSADTLNLERVLVHWFQRTVSFIKEAGLGQFWGE